MDHALSPKPQASSRAPSPVPSAVYASTHESRSSPRLPQPRRSSFSNSITADEQQRPLTTQRSFPHLSKKTRKHGEKQSRRGSDATTTDGGSEASFSITAAADALLVAPRLLANDKRNHDFHVLFRSVPDGERLIDGKSISFGLFFNKGFFLLLTPLVIRLWVCTSKRNFTSR